MTLGERLVRRAASKTDEVDLDELLLLRVKLEVRSWFLRFSLALNTGLIVWHLVQR